MTVNSKSVLLFIIYYLFLLFIFIIIITSTDHKSNVNMLISHCAGTLASQRSTSALGWV